MYSVQDLLVSHGYKLSRSAAAPHEESHKVRQQARGRAGQGVLNGCEDGRAMPPQSKATPGKGNLSDSESSRRHLQRAHGEPPRSLASGSSDAGFCDPPVLVWTSQPQPGQQQTYWRRRGQEACGLRAPGAPEELGGRRMAQAHMRQSPWEVGGRSEDVLTRAWWEAELSAAQWREGSPESWGQPRRHMSDGDGELLFRDLYPFVPGEQALNPQSRGKSRSLPRVLSPEGLSCTEIPIPLNDGHLPGAPNVPFYPPNCPPHLEPTRHPRKGGSAGAFPRPKFGRPLGPPPYKSYQHARGAVASSGTPDGQRMNPHAPCGTKSSEPRPESCLSDPALEPPVYVPPPSYHSPPQHIPNPYLEEAAPRLGGRSPQPHPGEKAGLMGPPPASSLSAGHEYGASPRSPRSPRVIPPQPRPPAATTAPTAPDGSVLYIPFDDPRIRHIRLAEHQGFCEEPKRDELPRYIPVPVPQTAPGAMLLYDALWHPQSAAPPPGQERGPVFTDAAPPWLWDQLLRDGESSGVPDPRGPFGVVREQRPDPRGHQLAPAGAPAVSSAPPGESSCKTQTRLRKFETGIPTKKSAKKKTNETIFCLVSIPVQSEPRLLAADMNHKDSKRGAAPQNGLDKSLPLREQSLLSMSATDLELQALTGSMAGRAGLPSHDPAQPGVDKQADDLSPLQPRRHGGLKPSGSWPEHQYRDQQTQTSLTEELRTSAPLPAAEVCGGPNTVLAANFIDPAPPETQVHPALRPNACHLKGQMSLNLSSNSAFSRTPLSTGQALAPKEGPRQSSVEGRGNQASPKLQGEGTKGPSLDPGHSKELFGQFLLKPVSRRPWDLISQLESFNKELQEEEGSGHSSRSGTSDGSSSSNSEDSDTEWPQEGRVHPAPKNSGFTGNFQEQKVEALPWMLLPKDPDFGAGERVKSKSESWSDEQRPVPPSDQPPSPGPCAGDSQPEALRSLVVEKGTEARVSPLASSPAPVKRTSSSSRFCGSKPASRPHPADLREPQERQSTPSVVSSQGLSKADSHVVNREALQGPALPLSLASKARGLSAPDLRSMGLAPPVVPSASGLDGSLGTVGATEIPPNESLQERAARILGIEVAVESLLPTGHRCEPDQPPEPSERVCRPKSPGEVALASARPLGEPSVSADAFYGRRKCGWTHSPLFVGERESVRRAPEEAPQPRVDAPSSQQSEAPNHKDAPSKPPSRPTLLHVVETSPSAAAGGGGERKLRGTSKVIESLQEKLASPPRRAAPERLMRMKEVSSVSRMRLLTSLGPDSTEEPGDPALEEKGHQAAPGNLSAALDFWCPDFYDPSRVERV